MALGEQQFHAEAAEGKEGGRGEQTDFLCVLSGFPCDLCVKPPFLCLHAKLGNSAEAGTPEPGLRHRSELRGWPCLGIANAWSRIGRDASVRGREPSAPLSIRPFFSRMPIP